MIPSENPLARRFWLGETDARVLALFRIAFSAVILFDLLDRLRDFHAFYTEPGILPHAVEVVVRGEWRWSLFDISMRREVAMGLYAAGVAGATALLLGYHTRLAAFVTWLTVLSVQARNELLMDGSDQVVGAVCCWMQLADLGARYSLDVRLGRRAPQARVAVFPLRLLRLQIALVYVFTCADKIRMGWLSHNYVYQIMQSHTFARWLGPQLARWPALCRAGTLGVLGVEALLAVLMLSPLAARRCRAAACVISLALHGTIFATLAVGMFPSVMTATLVLFVEPAWLDRLGWSAGPPAPASPRPLPRWVVAVAAIQMAVVVAVLVSGEGRVPLPGKRWLRNEVELVGLGQSWPMFANGLNYDVRWTAPGRLDDGTTIDVVAAAAPLLNTAAPPAPYRRWFKMRFELAKREDGRIYQAFLGYLCRRYNASAGPLLVEVDLTLVFEMIPLARGQAITLQGPEVMWHRRCADEEPVRATGRIGGADVPR